MNKKIIKSKMIRDDYLQVDCENGCHNGLDANTATTNVNNNSICVGDDMICPECGQEYHWGNYVGVKMTLTRGK